MLLMFTVLMLSAPKPVPPIVEKFLKDNDLSMEATCDAAKRLKIIPWGKIPACEVGTDGITEVRDKAGCSAHYTLFEDGDDVICQCNRGSLHSELIVLKETHDMNNLKFPCLRKCYPAMIKYLIGNGKVIHLTYKKIDSDAANKLHELLLKNCRDWTRD
jgi:hypothetical protein